MRRTKCPLCKSVDVHQVVKDDKYIFKICQSCGLLFLKNPPKASFYKKFYTYSDDAGFNKKLKKDNPLLSAFLRNPALLKLVSFWGDRVGKNWESSILQIKQKGKVLDVGCGPGMILRRLQKVGWEVYGVEVGDRLVSEAMGKVGSKRIYKGNLPAIYKNLPKPFDLISFWHVMEHISDFEKYIKVSSQLIKKDGVILIEVPHANSLNFIIFGKYWTLLMSPQHLHFWTKETLSRLITKCGLKVSYVYYPSYFSFVFSSSFIKKYPGLIFLTPFLMVVSYFVSLVVSPLGYGDVIRIYAVKK